MSDTLVSIVSEQQSPKVVVIISANIEWQVLKKRLQRLMVARD